jgi:DMSO/TMAO reductase YedYZ molybdopterin-dependent catalytic subunit
MHIAIKIPRMWRGLRSISIRDVLRTSRTDTVPEPYQPDGLAAEHPAAATISRRGALALVGGGALLMAVITAGQTFGGITRRAALLLPRGRTHGDGPNDFQINRTAFAAGISPDLTGDRWRLTLTGGGSPVVLDRAALTAMPQHTARLPIACVEGWSTTETWSGVALADLARLAGVPHPASAFVRSVERRGGFNRATLQANQVVHPDALLALRVNDADLSPDHGYPARIIVPGLPGVHNTKWVASIDFRAG